eukprot:282609-Prymnesium_polylepis.1
MAEAGSAVDASRLGALLSSLQSAEYVIEAAATRLAGEHGGWAAVTLLELWRTLCRLRLLLLMPTRPTRLLRSVASDEQHTAPQVERWSSVVGRIGGDSQLRERARSSQLARSGARPSAVDGELTRRAPWLTARTAGELLHALQPLAYLLMLLAQRARARRGGSVSSLAARLPWLTALAIEVIALRLCLHRTAPQQATGQDATGLLGTLLGRRAADDGAMQRDEAVAREEAAELEHRRKLILLFLLRPAARAATLGGHPRAVGRGPPSSSSTASTRAAPTATLERPFNPRATREAEPEAPGVGVGRWGSGGPAPRSWDGGPEKTDSGDMTKADPVRRKRPRDAFGGRLDRIAGTEKCLDPCCCSGSVVCSRTRPTTQRWLPR